jgi:hypothetical protein
MDMKEPKSTREAAYKAIDTEREYQEIVWGDCESSQEPGTPGFRTLDEYILYIKGYADQLAVIGATSDSQLDKLNFVRKVAGLSVACMEQHGSPARIIPADLKK